ncbi:unnamed protein product [Schistosoma margrebowiei]|uniref:Uncharacterized protein n=1 Tax=Schistosoma margrebowiei TaxID=48269 RepID=A0A183LZB8_9TREM|nr:unnamed protein product [Schistosoma margrebowiei]
MLINITDFRWCENLSDIDLIVPLHGISVSNVDTLITSQYVKMLNIYRLTNTSEDRKRLLQIKQNAILEHQEREMKRAKANKDMNIRGEKYALEQVMKLENVSREKIRLVKEHASKQAISEFVNAFNQSSQKENELQNEITEARRFAKQYITETINEENNMELNKNIQQRLAFVEKPIDLPVRTSSTIEVKFTPRVFPTPERESTKQAEDEGHENRWITTKSITLIESRKLILSGSENDEERKQIRSRLTKSLRNDREQWWATKAKVMEKAAAIKRNIYMQCLTLYYYLSLFFESSLFQAGDYEAAVVAYTEAITQNPKLHSAYSNRAACHLQLRNYFKALEDSSMVLDLCVPPVAQNLKSRVRAHIRRGAAFCNLQLYKEGLIEYRAAQKLQPDDDTIRKDIENLEKFVNQE